MNRLNLSSCPRVLLCVCLLVLASLRSPAATVYWDADGSTAGNAIDGTGLGGTGTWDTSTANWWNTAALINWPNTNADVAVFSYAFPALGVPVENLVTLTSGIAANGLRFERSGYTLTGGDLTLAGDTPSLHAGIGESVTIGSNILGTDGLNVTGGGSIRLTNNGNTYTGDTNIDNGTLIITGEGALGLDASIIDINGSSSRAFGGGSLFLDGSAGGFTITRDVDISGRGPITDRGTPLLSIGDNTLSGTVRNPQNNTNTRATSIEGTLTFSGTLNTAGASNIGVFASFGGINDVGTGDYAITGVLTGDGNIEKSGGGMLLLNPTDTSGFSGNFRIGNSTYNQGGIRVTNGAGVLGTNSGTGIESTTTSNQGAVLDINSGLLESRQDTQVLTLDGGGLANVYQRANAVIVVDNAPSDTSIETGGTLELGSWSADDNRDLFLEGRNGYNVMIGDVTEIGGTGANMDFYNRLEGGILTIGNLQFSGGNGNQNLRFVDGANGSTVITGDVTANGTGTKQIIKDGQGTVTILGTGSSGIGIVNIDGGTLAITDFRSIGGATSILIDGNASSTSNGTSTLEVGTSTAPGSAADLTTAAAITIDGANGQDAIIRAVQTGANPVIFNGAVSGTVAGASRDLILGGTNTLDNALNGTITQLSSDDDIRIWKIGSGTWVLGGAGNAYEGGTLIGQGTLKARANADASTIIPDDSEIRFVIHGNRPGPNQSLIDESNGRGTGVFEFVGFGGNSIETVGVLNADDNANTVRLTPNGGTASLIFAGIDEPDVDATINFIAPAGGDTISFTAYTGSTTDIFHAGTYFNGSDFALITGAATPVRAPIYGTDPGFANAIDTGTFVAGDNVNVQADLTTSGALAIKSLRIDGSTTNTLTLGGLLTIQDNGAANDDGGIILTGGDATITGANITAGGTGDFYVRVEGAPNTLTLSSGVPNSSDGSFVKSGLGTLIIDTALNFGDSSSDRQAFLEGTTRLSGSGSLANRTLYLGHDATLELQGNDDSIRGLEGGGVIDNISATGLTLTVGNSNQGGVFGGIITESGGGRVSVVKGGTATLSLDGSSSFTGAFTVGSTGQVDFSKLANIGVASSLGAGDATSDATNAASLVFTGNSATGNMGRINYDGWETVTTDRLFTLGGTGADAGGGIIANGVTNANMVWSNPGTIAITDADSNQMLRLGGGNTGDNAFLPQLVDPSGLGVLSLYKQGGGNWALLNQSNSYTGATQVGLDAGTDDGVLIITGTSLPALSGLALNSGQIATSGTFTRDLVATLTPGNSNEVSMAGGGTNNNRGFASAEGDLTVTLSGGAALTWGAGGFIPDGQALRLNSSQLSNGEVNFTNDIDLGATKQFIVVEDNGHTGYDFATLSGDLSGTAGLRVDGGGVLRLTGDNSYSGPTEIDNAELHIKSLGNSAIGGNTSVGVASNLQADGILMQGNGNSPSVLVYTGAGEITDRYISIEANAGNTNQEPRIYASGTGPLILTNLHNNSTAASKQLYLRGNNAAGNMITSVIGNSGANPFEVVVDGGATWILTGANTYSGTTHLNAGAAGVGNDSAFGTGTISMNNGLIFAHGADRTIANNIQVDNNTTMGYIGVHSLTFTDSAVVFSNTGNNSGLNNNIDTTNGSSLTFDGVLNWDSITAARTFSVGGNGDTNLLGGIDTSTAFGVHLNKNNAGTLTLGNVGVVNNGRNDGNTNIDNGTLKIAAGSGDGVLPSVVGALLNLDPESGENATFDVNGNDTTVSGFISQDAGNSVIDNSSSTSATFTVGTADEPVTIGANTTITDRGSGSLSLQKTGTAATTIPSAATLTYEGNTGVDGGGSLTIDADLASTTGLSVAGAGSLLDIGSLSGAAGVTSVVVSDGGTLDLAFNSVGDSLSSLTTLNLGATTGVTLNLDAGDSGTDLLSTAGPATVANTITLNITDLGMTAGTTYTLLSAGSGLATGTFSLGTLPGGFTGFTTNFTDFLVQITPTALDAESTFFWTGTTDDTWNGNANNFSTDAAGTTPATMKPGAFDTVSFVADAHGGGSLTTTLVESFTIGQLVSRSSTATPADVTIAPGAAGALSLNPAVPTDGITLETGSAPSFTISAPLNILADQEWNIVDGGTALNISGGLGGEADVSIIGAGQVSISAAAQPGFNAGGTSDVTVGNGTTLTIGDANALSGSVNAASITIDAGGAFYPEGATNIPNDIVLNGGTLSTDNANRVLLGNISTTADSTINTVEFNAAVGGTTDEGRDIVFRGALTGSNTLTILGETDALWDGIVNFASAEDGSGADTSGFTGDWILDGGRLRYDQVGFNGATNFQTSGDFYFIGDQTERGIVEWNRIEAGTIYDLTGMNVIVANAAGDARGRLLINDLDTTRVNGNVSGTTTVVQLGTVTLGDANGPGHLEFDSSDSAFFQGTDQSISQFEITGGVVLANDGILENTDGSTHHVIDGGISETGGSRLLTIRGSSTANSRLELRQDSTHTGGTFLDSGSLLIATAGGVGTGDITFNGGSLGVSTDGLVITNNIEEADTNQIYFYGDDDNSVTFTDSFDIPAARTIRANGDLILDGGNTAAKETVTFTGAIGATSMANGSLLILEGNAQGAGVIRGGYTQSGIVSDVSVTGGEWTIDTSTFTVANHIFIQTNDSILNLDTADILVSTAGANGSVRVYNDAVLNINTDQSFFEFNQFRVGVDGNNTGTVNLANGVTVGDLTDNNNMDLILGLQNPLRDGHILVNGFGSGNTATIIADNLDLYSGIIQANLVRGSGNIQMDKYGPGTVTLSGDNSGWNGGNQRTRVFQGELVLDYTVQTGQKISNVNSSELEMRGSTVTLLGHASTPVIEDIGANSNTALVLTDGVDGYNVIAVNNNGADIGLQFGSINRNVGDGTILFDLSNAGASTSTNGVITDEINNGATGLLDNELNAAYALVKDASGMHFATSSSNAANGNIIGFTSTVGDSIASWGIGDHVTDAAGFSGTVAAGHLASLRFDAAANSTVDLGSNGTLHVDSGGILLTDNVIAGTQNILGGVLSSGGGELIVHNYATNVFEIGSSIRGTDMITISGTGTTDLTGEISTSGRVNLFGGTLRTHGNLNELQDVFVSQGSAVTWELTTDEEIRRLLGGREDGGGAVTGTINLGTHNLTINFTGGNNNFGGEFVGSGNVIVKGNNDFQILGEISDTFTGDFIVDGGKLRLDVRFDARNAATEFTIQNGGMLEIDNTGNTRDGDRINGNAAVTLISADGGLNANPDRALGFFLRTDQASTNAENIGDLVLGGGHSYVTIDARTAADDPFIQPATVVRNNASTLTVRGWDLGEAGSGAQVSRLIIDNANEVAFRAANEIGGGGALGTTTISIVPWAVGSDAGVIFENADGDINPGNSFAQYEDTNGFRVLDLATEYSTFGTLGGATDNVRESAAAPVAVASAGPGITTVNSLILDNIATPGLTVMGAGAGESLEVTSGGFLFTSSGAVAAATSYDTTLGGFDGITTASGEYIFHVINPNLSDATIETRAVVASALTSTAVLTKSGRGTLVLQGPNTALTGVNLNDGTLEILDNDHIGGDVGTTNFAGGTLSLASGFGDDLSLRSNSFLGGTTSTLTLGGNTLAFGNDLGTGSGHLIISGGDLTLNATSARTGDTTIAGGTVTLGANDAIGSGGDVLLAAGGTLALGANDLTSVGTFATNGASPGITGTGTITASDAFFFDNSGATSVDATLGGNAVLLKEQGNTLTLNASNTYTGQTIVGAGTLAAGANNATGAGGDLSLDNATLDTGTFGLTHGIVSTSGASPSITGTGTITGTAYDLNNTGASTISAVLAGGSAYLRKDEVGVASLTGANTYGGPTEIHGGTLQLGDGGTTGSLNTASTITVSSGATFAVNRSDIVTQGTEFNSVITGAGGFSQTGAGTTILNAGNTYTGPTTVSGGTLEVNNTTGSGTGSGNVNVSNAGSTLSGSGTIFGSTILGSGTILAPGEGPTAGSNKKLIFTAASTAVTVDDGASIELSLTSSTRTDPGFDWTTQDANTYLNTLTSNGSDFSAAAYTNNWQTAESTYDSIVLTNGIFNLGTGTGTVSLVDNGGTYSLGNIFKLLDWNGLVTNTVAGTTGGFSTATDLDFSGITLGSGLGFDTSAFSTYGVVVIVPEPSRLLLLGLGLFFGVFRRRRSN